MVPEEYSLSAGIIRFTPAKRGKGLKIGVVSEYPPLGYKHVKLGGVASYTKNLVTSLLNHCIVTVYANRVSYTDRKYYDENVLICRCWKKSVLYPFQIFKKLLNSEIDILHVQHEIYLYGGLSSAILFPLLLCFIKLLRKPVVVTMHGLIPLSEVNGNFLRENWIKGSPLIMRIGLILLVKLITFLSNSIIVHEEKFKEVLRREYGCLGHKVYVVHHGIEEIKNLIDKNEAKEKLSLPGKNVILFFGYIMGYKNVELLIESANFLKIQDWVMIIAGGAHPRMSANLTYRRYISDLREKALATFEDKILFKGFIDEEDIPLYFSAADLVIFPYRIVMSSSGPMYIAFSYKRPFLISNNFNQIFKIEELIFEKDPKALAIKIQTFFQNKDIKYRALKYVEQLCSARSWRNVAKKTIHIYKSMIK